jgi:hypothetical protein
MVKENHPINFKMLSGLYTYQHHFFLLSKASSLKIISSDNFRRKSIFADLEQSDLIFGI